MVFTAWQQPTAVRLDVGPLSWRKFIPGTENIANYTWLVRPWILEEKLITATLLNQYTFQRHSKSVSLYPQISVVLSPLQRSLFEADRNHYRELQVIKMQKTTGHGLPSLTCSIYNTTLVLGALRKRGTEIIRPRATKSVETVFSRNGMESK